jgi:hypothetical protein
MGCEVILRMREKDIHAAVKIRDVNTGNYFSVL